VPVNLGSGFRMLQRKEGKRGVKFVVKVNRGVTRALEYVQRIDRTPIQMTTNRKLALMMGRLAAEDAVKSIQNSRCSPELVPVQV
jgi:Zn/Cd-binding protein ZinT